MYALILFVVHWYLTILMQSFWHHRVSSHGSLVVNRTILSFFGLRINVNWARIIIFISWIISGPSYLSNYVYAILHRLHHRYVDEEGDPHSPKNHKTLIGMMRATAVAYGNIRKGIYNLSKDTWVYEIPIPQWKSFDVFAGSIVTRVLWAFVYIALYYFSGAPLWLWIPLCAGSIMMNPLHGALVNWYSHKYGIQHHKMNNTSTNFLGEFVDVILCAEFYHNDHHFDQTEINFGKSRGKLDIVYEIIIRPLLRLKIISYSEWYKKKLTRELAAA